MANENVNDIPDNESTGSNDDDAVTSPTTECQICSNPIPRNPNKQTSSKHPLQGPKPPTLVSPPPQSLSINPNNSFARVIPSRSQPINANRTHADVVRSTPPPKTSRTTPQDPTLAALWMNSNAARGCATSQAAALWTFDDAAENGEILHHRFHPYLRPVGQQPPRTVDFLSRMENGGSPSLYPSQIDEQMPLRTVDFLSGVNNHPWRMVDFLSQMEAASSARPEQVPRANPPIEMVVEWASSLRVGDGKRRKVDLNLKL
ncbi:hypothetical protein AAZX31_03G129000 [Glycine max]|nr:hypothetical protein GLYMA_03G146850v4 [Glycine max]KAG5043433.1 hypothetical protein JHK87_007348 [Glycine soja]KAG5055221.1 hypothetical protein JHK85_007731 [Glycine max]KAG5072299.1 hypothetical protein JHK86_007510 [Glycine max]KAH1070049.1 hypothetical protein GYH30_007253 [Glycine max]